MRRSAFATKSEARGRYRSYQYSEKPLATKNCNYNDLQSKALLAGDLCRDASGKHLTGSVELHSPE
jgi:hypothetical protein